MIWGLIPTPQTNALSIIGIYFWSSSCVVRKVIRMFVVTVHETNQMQQSKEDKHGLRMEHFTILYVRRTFCQYVFWNNSTSSESNYRFWKPFPESYLFLYFEASVRNWEFSPHLALKVGIPGSRHYCTLSSWARRTLTIIILVWWAAAYSKFLSHKKHDSLGFSLLTFIAWHCDLNSNLGLSKSSAPGSFYLLPALQGKANKPTPSFPWL